MKRALEILIAIAAGALCIEIYFLTGAHKRELGTEELGIMFLTVGALFLLINVYFKKRKKEKNKK